MMMVFLKIEIVIVISKRISLMKKRIKLVRSGMMKKMLQRKTMKLLGLKKKMMMKIMKRRSNPKLLCLVSVL